MEISGGIFLLLSSFLALFWMNSSFHPVYENFVRFPILGNIAPLWDVELFVNDVLMSFFFLLVGLEIKRELLVGELSNRKKAKLPFVAALGGMVVPALIFFLINHSEPTLRGWGIPVATDIAFALGVFSFMSKRIPLSAKILLLALAIIDDIGAIVIISLFYTKKLSLLALGLSLLIFLGIYSLRFTKRWQLLGYILLGSLAWFAVLKSGVHATIAGIVLGFIIPISQGKTLIKKLHPYVMFLVLPLFAFANSGIPLGDLEFSQLVKSPLSLGIVLGLILGKPLGILSFSWIFMKLKWCELPSGVTWKHFVPLSIISGIGFTMSIFISSLAFDHQHYLHEARLSIIVASLVAAFFGVIWMFLFLGKKAIPPN